jgi:FkbM family methyltransferase
VRDGIKAVVRSFARNRVIKKRLPADLGGAVMFCSPDALLSTWEPGWQSEQALHLFEWARRYVKPGHVVWDIGANQGLFTFAAAAAVGSSGKVVAFEPDPFLTGLLHRSRHAQCAETRVDILPVAVSGGSGVATFCVAAKDRALNHLAASRGNPRTGGDRERLAVVTVSLQWAAEQLPPPDLIKIDVEGGELEVLQHAGRRLLEDIRPLWIIEVAPENARHIEELLHAARYRLFDANQPDRQVERPAWNTLAVPEQV